MFCKTVATANKLLLFVCAASLISCSKEKAPSPPTDPCAGKTIEVTASAASSDACSNNGTIDVSATGSAGFTYKLNASGAYQASGIFNNVSGGTYTVFAKDADGCEKSKTVTVATRVLLAGPLFTEVQNLMAATCQPCHNNSVQNGGMNWANNCNIVQFQERIRVRAVVEGTMPNGGPELTPSEKATITNWINAGGRISD